jgi:hypothetical protein
VIVWFIKLNKNSGYVQYPEINLFVHFHPFEDENIAEEGCEKRGFKPLFCVESQLW